ncbi:MAG: L-threonylcarbamoyladenylate synthase [Bacteroidales bacterium]|jgi:tRNA threonylcarbamoyl adenosine modification protein (Sua5/YciO/YrdC/YwlC family)|nr:L-threonylcarbamoyladenylate synthase [Bacteroidales bacterium]MDD2569978.1 L-threonylcarbamoyladenylate synthase [Bacteroidales bacterium]MDD2812586.1 L-threonylcarbamoyladenylate synthase [Bacteroidales bacterium]MDD3385153.1 L-threonylcarbamoyladenylate synthase [Bacteroidales bacterium]MDD3811612.1 L-threonylcarbamoyladenylate synthase [Bacteroidales bacterium]
MLRKIYPVNPNPKEIRMVVDILREGGVIIYPTDTIYGLGCDITHPKAIDRIAHLKGIKAEKAQFSFIVYDLSHLSDYTKPINNTVYKLMKRHLPGPFTFILEANNNVPKILKTKKKTVGIRIPDNPIIREIVRELGNPILNTSVHSGDVILEYNTDPELIHEEMGHLVDIVIDGGFGNNIASTVVDCTGPEPMVLREGLGVLEI